VRGGVGQRRWPRSWVYDGSAAGILESWFGMSRLGKFLWLVGITLIMQSRVAMAWNAQGHMVCSFIAYQQLTAEQKAAIAAILQQHPHYKNYLLVGAPEDTAARDEYVFMKASTWPDAVRPPLGGHRPLIKDDAGDQANVTKYSHAQWHYVDKIYVLPAEAADAANDGKMPDAPQGDALKAIRQAMATLKSATARPDEKAVSLCWLLHLLGDIHQPLHCVTLVSAELPLPDGDRGGNFIFLATPAGHLSLHAYWDGLLGSVDMANFSSLDVPAVEYLAQNVMKENAGDSLPQRKEHDTAPLWVDEGYVIARQSVYLNGKLLPAGWTKSTVVTLPADYPKNATAVARRQVALAGYRIADTLKSILGH
jgi:hypothetical protein